MMEEIEQTVEEVAETVVAEPLVDLWQQGQAFLATLTQPWKLYQLGIFIGCLIVAYLLSLWIMPKITRWLRGLTGRPTWQMRFLIILKDRTMMFIWVALVWIAVLVLREVTWPSRSYMLSILASLATAWLIIAVITRLIRRVTLRRIVRWGAWIFVTLYYFGLLEQASQLLDSAAVEIGDYRISLLLILKAGLTIIALMIAARMLSRTTASRIDKLEDISPSMKVLSVKFAQLIFYGLALVFGLKAVGFDITNLAILSGAIGIGLGFGLQKVVSNLVSGVILLLDKSIKPGDVISLGDTFGWIESLGARYVSVLTRNGREYLIPNEDLITNQVVNWSHSNDLVRLDIHFGVAYDSDPHLVKKIATAAPPQVKRVLNIPQPVCHIVGFGDSSIDFILRFWIKDPTKGLTNVRGDVFLALWDALKENDIEIPFPRRDVTVLNQDPPEPLLLDK